MNDTAEVIVTEEMVDEQAWEIYSWIQDAVGDVARNVGRSADDLYNDAGTLQDLLGDRIGDAVVEMGVSRRSDRDVFKTTFNRLVEALGARSNRAAWIEALVELHY